MFNGLTGISFLSRFFLFSLILPAFFVAHAQKTESSFDQVYGFDPLLYNGKVYNFFPSPGTSGTQYFIDDFDTGGIVRLRGKTFTGVALNYDLLNQQLILKYKSSIGSNRMIILSDAWLEEFEIGGSHFRLLSDNDTVKRIYKVLGDGKDKVLYFLTRELLLDNTKAGGMHYFTAIKTKISVLTSGRIVNVRNNRGFIAAFEPINQDPIKKYIHKQKINVRKATEQSMNELINYCSSLNKR